MQYPYIEYSLQSYTRYPDNRKGSSVMEGRLNKRFCYLVVEAAQYPIGRIVHNVMYILYLV